MTTRIYCFIDKQYGPEVGTAIKDRRIDPDVPSDGDCFVVAVTEDGKIITTHYSSSLHWAKHDIGITSDWKHDTYKELFPEGYELVWGRP